MNFGLSDEQEMIVSTVRSFVEKEIYPHEDEVERTGEVRSDIAEAIKSKTIELGFYACNFPESAGGAGLSHLDFALVERELGRGSMALTHFFGRPQNILMACRGDQIERYLKPAVSGERMDALAMTEPDAGSDIRGMKCSATREGDDWVVNGNKHFISGAEHADFVIVFVGNGRRSDRERAKEAHHRLSGRPRHTGLHHSGRLPLGVASWIPQHDSRFRQLPPAPKSGAR